MLALRIFLRTYCGLKSLGAAPKTRLDSVSGPKTAQLQLQISWRLLASLCYWQHAASFRLTWPHLYYFFWGMYARRPVEHADLVTASSISAAAARSGNRRAARATHKNERVELEANSPRAAIK